MANASSSSSDMPTWQLRNGEFAGALLDPDTPIPVGAGKNGKPALKRFSVYRNNVVASLMDSLKSAYPSLLAIMGEENFNLVARNYVANCPSKTPMMQNYGDQFAEFIAGFKPLAKSPFLVEVAIAERNWIECHHAIDADVLSAEKLQEIAPEKTLELVFEPHPASRLQASNRALFDLFDARNHWPRQGFQLDSPQSILFTRPDLQTIAMGLHPAMAGFFRSLLDGESLGAAIGGAMEMEADFDPAAAISLMLESGGFSAIRSH